jgi:hypothetical protein
VVCTWRGGGSDILGVVLKHPANITNVKRPFTSNPNFFYATTESVWAAAPQIFVLAGWRLFPPAKMAGKTYDVVVLSSSPPAASPLHAPPSRRVAMHPSSPTAFSPPASPLRKTLDASSTNLRAASIAEGAVRGFATVGSLIQSEHFTSCLDDEFAEIQSAQERKGSLDVAAVDPVPTKKPTKKRATNKPTAEGVEKPKPKPRARKQTFKSATQIEDSDEELRLPPRPRPSTKSPFFDEPAVEPPNDDAVANTDAPKLTKSGKPRKPRAKKQMVGEDGVEAPPKPKRARVTKPKTVKEDGKGQRGVAEITSAHFRKDADNVGGSSTHEQASRKFGEVHDTNDGTTSIWDIPQSPRLKKKVTPKERPPDPIAEGLELDEAILRRRDWTPPPADTTIPSPFTNSSTKENKQSVRNADGTFTNLLSNFTYAQSPSAARASSSTTAEVVPATKRRRVELVEIPSNQINSREQSPEKGKAPKKKPRTITDLVTEQYARKSVEPEAATSNFFSPRTTVTKVPLNDTPDAAPKKAPRKRNTSKSGSEKADPKSRAKKASAKTTAKKSKPVAEKLLSPASALLRMNRQDILFGTSSQLALEESPTMVRQLQYAIKESEHEPDIFDSDFFCAPPPRFKMQGKRGLWAVSARDDEGGMLEQIEDVRMPEPDRTQDFPLLMMDGAGNERDEPPPRKGRKSEEPAEPDEFIHIDDIVRNPPPAVTLSSDLPTPPRPPARVPKAIGPSKADSETKEAIFMKIDDYQQPPPSHQKYVEFDDIDNYQEPPPSNQNADCQNSTSVVDIDEFDFPSSAQMRTSPALKFKPPYSASTTKDGSPKKRGRPPKSSSAIPAVSRSFTPVLKPLPAKRNPKAKAKENAGKEKLATPQGSGSGSGRFIDLEEILDSEDEALETLSPTPPRVCNLPNITPLPLISLSPTSKKPAKAKAKPNPFVTQVHRIKRADLEWVNIKPHIFAQISQHVRALPPTTDPTRLTWHEKILMYTPIILEDFTLYLNNTPSTPIRTWKKATKAQVKAFNAQQKSMGSEAVSVEGIDGLNGGEEMVLAVEKELEMVMVQGWCESFSICCVYGEKKGSGARKGLY